MWVIYDRPSDHPGGFVVRSWSIVAGGGTIPGEYLGKDLPTLNEARELIPNGAYNLGRYPEDDPKIVEVWV